VRQVGVPLRRLEKVIEKGDLIQSAELHHAPLWVPIR